MHQNTQDFPLKGLPAKIVRYISPIYNPQINPNFARTNPGRTLKELIKNTLKDKRVAKYLLSGYLCELTFTAIYTSIPIVIASFIEIITQQGITISFSDLSPLLIISLIMMLSATIANFLGVRQVDSAIGIMEAQIRRQLTWWVLGHSAGWFSSREAGQIAHRITEVTKQTITFNSMAAYQLLPTFVALTVAGTFMFLTDLYAGIFYTIWAAIFTYMSIRLGLISKKFMVRRVKRQATASGTVTDAIINNSLIRLFNARETEDAKVETLSTNTFQAWIDSASWARVKNFIRDIWIAVLIVSMLTIFSHAFITSRITAAEFVGGMGILFVLISQIRALHHIIRDFMESAGTIEEALNEIALPHDIPEPKATTAKLKSHQINLNQVNFSYHNNKQVLANINLKIPQGQKVGIVGQSGAGKTTLMALILRLWDIEKGEISIDDKNIKDIPAKTLRDSMALIPQDTSLFHRTLMENIRYGKPSATDAEVIAAAKKAHAHEFITELPESYQTLVGERGVKLSGGQRQRIAIARAILKNSPILILDEATSALDSESEQLIQESLYELMEGKTVIAIAHRLSTISHLDRLIVMKNGQIIEDGTHQELIKQKGTYAKLWNMQSNGFIGD